VRWIVLTTVVIFALVLPFASRAAVTTTGTLLAQDSFGRVSSAGWKAADVGGTYTHPVGADDFAVDGGAGIVRLALPARQRRPNSPA